jgi:hypothetical protein
MLHKDNLFNLHKPSQYMKAVAWMEQKEAYRLFYVNLECMDFII